MKGAKVQTLSVHAWQQISSLPAETLYKTASREAAAGAAGPVKEIKVTVTTKVYITFLLREYQYDKLARGPSFRPFFPKGLGMRLHR